MKTAAGGAIVASLILPFAGQAAAQQRDEHRGGQGSREEHRGGQGSRDEHRGDRGFNVQARHRYGRVIVRNNRDFGVYRRPYLGRPGFRTYGAYYGLVPALQVFPTLGFLADGLLVGSYFDNGMTDYVYVVQEDGVNRQYVVDNRGRVVSVQVVP